jgi:hypothetical protein
MYPSRKSGVQYRYVHGEWVCIGDSHTPSPQEQWAKDRIKTVATTVIVIGAFLTWIILTKCA